jgi:amino acid transporter
MSQLLEGSGAHVEEVGVMRRDISWTGAFFVAAGVPALVLFSIGAISATVGALAWIVWIVSVLAGFVQAFTYAEIAGLHPSKTGGTAVHGATAWIRYSKYTAPMSLWCNWIAWSPVLSIGSGLAAGYLLSIFFAPDAKVNTWSVTLVNLGFLKEDLVLRINGTFFLALIILLVVFAIQHRGILQTARIQTVMTIGTLIPLFAVCIIPLITGDVLMANFSPFTPLALDSAGTVIPGVWNIGGWTLILGGFFIAAWSTYGFETAVCYMSEFKDPGRDMSRAILWSGALCVVAFSFIPFVFQGVIGPQGMLASGIYDGSGVGLAMAGMVHAGVFVTKILVVLLFFSLLMTIMTSMAGSSRTLYQGGNDGWLPKYLDKVNKHGAPTNAMWTDLGFNVILLLMSNYVFVLAVSNVCYILFNFLNLNAGWIHRIDNKDARRPWRAPTPLLYAGTGLAFVNVFAMGAGADVWGKRTLLTGLIAAALIVPVFLFRHYVRDKGKFPDHLFSDLIPEGQTELPPKRAGVLPYIALLAGVVVMATGYYIFQVHG